VKITTYKELKESQQQINTILEPFEKKEKELRKKLHQEEVDVRKAQFQNIVDKIFYVEKHPFHGKNISLVKPISCTDFENEYNSCNIMQIEIENYEDKRVVIKFSYDTCRVDSFPNMKEITEELYEQVKSLAETNLQQSLNHFLCVGKI